MNITGKKRFDADATFTAQDFVEAARAYLGVRYYPQGRTRAGLDCGGFLLRLGEDLNYSDLQVLGYSQSPDGETFERLLDESLVTVKNESVQIGDILACDYGEGIQHTAIVTEVEPRLKVIHAKRKGGVSEHYLHGRDQRGWRKTYRLKHLA